MPFICPASFVKEEEGLVNLRDWEECLITHSGPSVWRRRCRDQDCSSSLKSTNSPPGDTLSGSVSTLHSHIWSVRRQASSAYQHHIWYLRYGRSSCPRSEWAPHFAGLSRLTRVSPWALLPRLAWRHHACQASTRSVYSLNQRSTRTVSAPLHFDYKWRVLPFFPSRWRDCPNPWCLAKRKLLSALSPAALLPSAVILSL